MTIAPHLFLVHIDKAAQYKKRNFTKGGLYNPEQYKDFKYNLQYGRIEQIGAKAAAEFPEARVGDLLVFHHTVEHKPRVEGDANFYDPFLIKILPDGNELRFVETEHQTFGVFKPMEGFIVPFKNQIFCHQLLKDSEIHTSKLGRKLVNTYQESLESKQTRLATLQQQRQELKDSGVFAKFKALAAMPTGDLDRKQRKHHRSEIEKTALKIEEVMNNLKKLETECRQLTTKINETTYDELTVLYINDVSLRQWGIELEAGDKVISRRDTGYPLDIQDTWFTLIRPEYVALVKKGDQYFAVGDTILVEAAPRLSVSKGGIIIPDSVDQQPSRGTIKMAGEGHFQAGEEVVWSKKSSVEIEIDGELYILLKQRDILYAVSDEDIKLQEDWVAILMENQKNGFIIIPDSARPKAAFGEVIHTGPYVTDVIPGERVCFNREDGKKVEIKDKMHVMIREEDIMGRS